MTAAKAEAYLLSKGWRKAGEHWRDKLTAYAWETSAAVKQQQWRDREAIKANGRQTTNLQP